MSFSKRPQSAELPPAHDHASFSKKPEMNEQNSLAREESPKYQRFADDHVEEYDEVDVAKHGPFDHPVPEDMGNKAIQRHPRPDARPVMRAFTMMCCVGIFCSHISLWGTFLTNEGRWDNMATSSVWLTLPVVFVVFWWEFASLVTSWARGRDITPVAHIVMQLLLGLACIVAIVFEGFYLAYWSSPLYRWDRLTQIVPEILVTLLLLCITGSVFTRFILAIKDHRRRKAAARLAKQPEQQEA
ncbi:uncharacterized protein E0L32_006761 [Thyridium curvatum]|uniref:Uncharacterized protein n=1 Tax=Thyridium curvatum TaxID=1093900 RepID=A0A507B747_9PEZI|nr:uncharacterized protein E0L32_006761 [Thyridium curvatum]TPX12881.1 hypothetical protein E0L32_006761 [Thyridium curvatum]